MRRFLLGAGLIAGLLVTAAPAAAHGGDPAKARRALTKAIGVNTNPGYRIDEIRVTRCRAVRHRGRHKHAFTCRAAVRLVYPDGTVRRCKNTAVTVRHHGRRYLANGSLAGYPCRTLVAGQAHEPPPPPPAPEPVPDTPPVTPPPVGPPTGPPPPPPAQTRSVFDAAPLGAPRQTKQQAMQYYQWVGWTNYFPANGYFWIYAKYRYVSLYCNLYDDYYQTYWWNGSQWVFYYAIYGHFIYGYGYDYTSSPIC